MPVDGPAPMVSDWGTRSDLGDRAKAGHVGLLERTGWAKFSAVAACGLWSPGLAEATLLPRHFCGFWFISPSFFQ